jgi:hypothetical protein
MIIKVLEQLIKTVSNSENEFPQEIPIGIAVKKMNITEITDFAELINPKTKKPYKKRCLLRTIDGQWLIVNHSFKELGEMKNMNNRTIVKGFYAKIPTRGTRSNVKNKSKT